jgi:hypothetical protein
MKVIEDSQKTLEFTETKVIKKPWKSKIQENPNSRNSILHDPGIFLAYSFLSVLDCCESSTLRLIIAVPNFKLKHE